MSVNETAARHPNRFLADLTQAMRSTAETARQATIDQCQADAKAYTEQLHARTDDEAASLRKAAEADVSAIRDWSKAEMERIRVETEQRIARRRELLERIAQLRPDPLPHHGRMNIEHVDRVGPLERRKADRRAVHDCDQGKLTGKPRRKGLLVIGRRDPRGLLGRGVVVRGQLADAGAKDFREQRRVVREERPQAGGGAGAGGGPQPARSAGTTTSRTTAGAQR